MENDRKLLSPSPELVKRFNSFWNPGVEQRETELFQNDDNRKFIIDEKMIPGIADFKAGDELLKTVFLKLRSKNFDIHDVETAVYLLDGIYHTYLKNHLHLSKQLYNLLSESNYRVLDLILNTDKVVNDNSIEAIQCVDAIARINENKEKKTGYCYSFSTKFCYWIAQDYFPIYDSIANGLLLIYLDKKRPSYFGKYCNFVKAYQSFIEKFSLEECTIKQIDVFLWTYGKALQSKEVQFPIAKYTQYKPLDNNMLID